MIRRRAREGAGFRSASGGPHQSVGDKGHGAVVTQEIAAGDGCGLGDLHIAASLGFAGMVAVAVYVSAHVARDVLGAVLGVVFGQDLMRDEGVWAQAAASAAGAITRAAMISVSAANRFANVITDRGMAV